MKPDNTQTNGKRKRNANAVSFFRLIFAHPFPSDLYTYSSTYHIITVLTACASILWVSHHTIIMAGARGGSAAKAANSESKPSKVGQRPLDGGPPLTLRDIQQAPVIWAKLSGYSWWPARVSLESLSQNRISVLVFFWRKN